MFYTFLLYDITIVEIKFGGFEMLYALVTLIIIAVILFALSFFMNDKVSELETQFEQFSMTSIQDTYQLNKKIKVLEEELLAPDLNGKQYTTKSNEAKKPLVIQKVYHLYQQGYSIEDIEKQTNLNQNDIKTILRSSK